MADNLQEALKRASILVHRLCRCADYEYQHELPDGSGIRQCSVGGCDCVEFRPAPLRVSLLEEPAAREGSER